MANDDVFEALIRHDDDDLVATQWWRKHMASRRGAVDRRTALMALAGLSAAAGAMGSLTLTACSSAPDATVGVPETSYELQKVHGWDIGGETEALIWGNGTTGEPIPSERLDGLVETLTPKTITNQPFYGPVLFQSVASTAPSSGPGRGLRELIRPLSTEGMKSAFLQGAGLSTLLEEAPEGIAVVVDLPGPNSVSFAAALANRLDPVFYFDNWPHPRGVVHSHRTLAAVLQELERFEDMAKARPAEAKPAFVLDADRLTPFEATTRFDNRYLALLPSAERMKALGIKQVMYVRPRAGDKELDDLNELFVSYRDAGIEVKLIAAEHFREVPQGQPVAERDANESSHYATTHRHDRHHHYGGHAGAHWFFFTHYAWGRTRYSSVAPMWDAPRYRPARRATQFDGPAKSADFGKTYVDRTSGKPKVSARQPHARSPSRGGTSGGGTRGGTSGGGTRGGTRSGGRSSWGRSGGGSSGA